MSPEQLQADFDALAKFGSTGDGGVNRPTFSDAHLAARAWFTERTRQSGLEARVDSAGNHSAFLACGDGEAPTMMLGSHLDSVSHGGRFDGALGVVAALEVLRVVQRAGLRLPFHLEAMDFTDEEGSLVGLLGSSALVGRLSPDDLGVPRGGRQALAEGLARAGLNEAGCLQARREASSLAGYLELHIEQGPRLERLQVQTGVVTAIVGIASYRLTFTGRANHAGTTPMDERLDAAQGAGAFILAARELAMTDFPGCTANTGLAQLVPGAYNIVPGQAVIGLECRAADEVTFARLEAALLERAQAEARRFGLGLEAICLGRHQPATMSASMQAVIAQAAQDLGLSQVPLASGAGHDAQMLVEACPSGMIFVPSVGGISHSPGEYSKWQDCLAGANVLLQAVLNLAGLQGHP